MYAWCAEAPSESCKGHGIWQVIASVRKMLLAGGRTVYRMPGRRRGTLEAVDGEWMVENGVDQHTSVEPSILVTWSSIHYRKIVRRSRFV